MGHYQKLYEKIKRNPKDVRFEDIDKLLQKMGGFERRNNGTSHFHYSHPDLKELVTIPKDKPIKPVYIKNALEKFESVVDIFGDEEKEGRSL